MPVTINKGALKSPLAKSLVASSLAYANRGWRIHPLAPSSNDQPLLTAWQHKATADVKQIKEWWATTPEANVAIACGVESGLIVVDVDVKDGKPGMANLTKLTGKHGTFTTLTARSPTGGTHYYFKSPGYKIGNRVGFVPGIDFRGDGGYIVAAPSRRQEGVYKWVNDKPVADCPEWLLDLIKSKTVAAPDAKGGASTSNKIKEGGRDVYLTSLAGAMRQKGAVQDAIHAALIEQNKSMCDPPLPDNQVAKIANSIAQYLPATSVVPTGITAAELFSKDIPEPIWIVPDIIPAGLIVLAGRPKIGKSWLILAVAIAVASGTPVFGKAVLPQEVLYLALEDNQPRLKKRLVQLLGDSEPPDHLHFFNAWRTAGAGGLNDLDAWLVAHPKVRFVVIDTLGRLRKASKPGGNQYQEDYEALAAVKSIADSHGVAILCVSHTRKTKSIDPFEMITGTTGITGAADTNMVLDRARGVPETILHITGRDVEEQALAMKFTHGKWQVLGEADKVILTSTKKKIIAAIKSAPPMGPLSIEKKSGLALSTVNKNLLQLALTGHVVQVGHGKYGLSPSSDT